MMKIIIIIKLYIIYILLSITTLSCSKKDNHKKEILSVTIEPQKYFLDKLSNDVFTINCITTSGSNPENFDLAPSQLMTIEKSKAFFKVGYYSIENILIDKLKQNKSSMIIIDCSKGISTLHDGHIHVHSNDSDHGSHANGDPHIWTSPNTARQMIDNMRIGLIQIDSARANIYNENFIKLEKEVNQTDSIIKHYISTASSKSFIIYHPSLSYFADEYGLNQLTIEHDGKQPSPIQLKQIIDKAKEEKVKVVFIQQEFDTKNAETIANEIGANIVTINQLSYNWSDELIKIAKAMAQPKNE